MRVYARGACIRIGCMIQTNPRPNFRLTFFAGDVVAVFVDFVNFNSFSLLSRALLWDISRFLFLGFHFASAAVLGHLVIWSRRNARLRGAQ